VAYWLRQGVWPIAGNFLYVEDVFSTWLYTGNGSTQTITNGIDLAGRGGLVWMKSRSQTTDHALYDTARGATFDLMSNSIAAQTTQSAGLTGFLSDGFSIGNLAKINTNGATYVSWTFREQPRFFDIVTYTGNGANRTIAHNLGSVPGCIIVKRTDTTSGWQVYHRSLANTQYMVLNSTAAAATGATHWNSTTPTDTAFSLGTDATVNANGGTYVAYIFAHNAGGFGATGTDNVISCGTYTGSITTLNLGYEPQLIILKNITAAADWAIFDNMRGFVAPGGTSNLLSLNTSGTGANSSSNVTSTGIDLSGNSSVFSNASGNNYIYIAIRRGPMRTPTTGTSVFDADTYTSNATAGTLITTNFPVDMVIGTRRYNFTAKALTTRLTGASLRTDDTIAEETARSTFNSNIGNLLTASYPNGVGNDLCVQWAFRRAPGFFDVVCYTGNGGTQTVSHNLGVAPELVITKRRNDFGTWAVYCQYVSSPTNNFLRLQSNEALIAVSGVFGAPTSSSFTVGNSTINNASAGTYVAYLFASCPGVNRVGTYTGTGATQVINCSFAAGARFVLIKRTDSTGGWYVWDSARGIVAGNDPYLALNDGAEEVFNTDWVDTAASGFELSDAAGNLVNTNGGSYIFLAIS
jgi:hypothetical protein